MAGVPGAAGYPDFVATDVGLPAPDANGLLHAEQTGLLVETTNTFALASYDAGRDESPRSNEIAIGYAAAAQVVDSDADGLTDAREDRNLNAVRDAGETDRQRADTDGDGTNDGAEVALGTDPTNPSSRPGPTPTRTLTPAPSRTTTATRTATATPSRTATPTRTAAATPTPVRTATVTPRPTATAAGTGTPSPATTHTPRPTATPTPVVTPTATVTPAPAPTPPPVGVLPAPTVVDVQRVD